jgi:hypothetical protein
MIIAAVVVAAAILTLIGFTYVFGQQLASAASMNYTGNKTGSSGNATSAAGPGKISGRIYNSYSLLTSPTKVDQD